jgi:hypothetical protein
LEFLGLLKDEIDMIKGASHPNLLVYSGLESAASGLFIVREWVHGFLLYDLLRLRRSLKPEEVMAVLEPLPATLDLISERGLGLVDVSIRKLFVSCPVDVQPDGFASFAKGDTRAWAKCTLKLNPLSLAPLLFRERRDWSSQTLVPSSRVLSMTQAEAGIRGTKAVRLLGRLVYELINGHAPSLRANERPSPLPLLNEAGNQALWKAWASAGEATPYRNCEEFWRMFKESVSDRIRPVAPPPAKPEADKPPGGPGRKTPSKNIIARLAIAAILVVSGLVYLRLHQSPPHQPALAATRTVVVPLIAGMTLDQAVVELSKLQLRLGATDAQPVSTVKPGTIISQSPVAGAKSAVGGQVNVIFAAPSTATPTPTQISPKKMSDEEIRAENDKVLQRLKNSGQLKMSDEKIRAENDKVLQRLKNSGQLKMSDEKIRAENDKILQRLENSGQ